jgi:hypothetical protein
MVKEGDTISNERFQEKYPKVDENNSVLSRTKNLLVKLKKLISDLI